MLENYEMGNSSYAACMNFWQYPSTVADIIGSHPTISFLDDLDKLRHLLKKGLFIFNREKLRAMQMLSNRRKAYCDIVR